MGKCGCAEAEEEEDEDKAGEGEHSPFPPPRHPPDPCSPLIELDGSRQYDLL